MFFHPKKRRDVMLLIFMSEHMFRSHDQSVKNTGRVFQIYKHGVVFLLSTLGPDTTISSLSDRYVRSGNQYTRNGNHHTRVKTVM